MTPTNSPNLARSPLAAAEDAKRRRDLAGEIGALQAVDAELSRQPWAPIRPGDVVLSYLPAQGDSPAYGETYLAVDDGNDVAGNAMLRAVSRTQLPDVEPAEEEPDYLLRYDIASGCWALDFKDLYSGLLEPWIDARTLTDPNRVESAQAWAVREITRIEKDYPREIQAWVHDEHGHWPLFANDTPADIGPHLTPFYELWFEAGPAGLVVIRAGAVVHGEPAREVVR